VREKQADLLQDCPWCPLRELREELGKVSRAFCILRIETFRSDLAKDLVAKLRVVEFF
jgi:hypothetical protein